METTEVYKIEEGYERKVTVSRVRSDKKVPFSMVGNGSRNAQGASLNLIKEMSEMTPQELWLFNLIEENRESYDSNMSVVKANSLTGSEKQRLKTGYGRLRKKDLVRRVKKEHYMINPRLIIPKDFEEQDAIYKGLK